VLTITRQLDLGQRKPPIGFWSNQGGRQPAVRMSSSTSIRAAKLNEPGRGSSPRRAVTVSPQPQERQRAERALSAIHSLKRAEILLDRQRLDEAQAEIQLGLESDPSHSECKALQAWIQVCKLGSSADLHKTLAVMSDALEKNPVNESIRFRRAQLLSRMGQPEEAQREYQFIVELNPRHVDAKREIRLWELRRGDKRASTSGQYPSPLGTRASERPQAPGLFGRIFRK
jgi:tetratricopeptide (TPR) repeat protein